RRGYRVVLLTLRSARNGNHGFALTAYCCYGLRRLFLHVCISYWGCSENLEVPSLLVCRHTCTSCSSFCSAIAPGRQRSCCVGLMCNFQSTMKSDLNQRTWAICGLLNIEPIWSYS